MNVLLTCAGRRNYLIQYFKAALAGRGHVLAADVSRDAPALAEADEAVIAPPVAHPHYVDFIHDLCLSRGVRLLLSLNDLELPILAAARERFTRSGITPVISSIDVIRVCSDKMATVEFLRESQICYPRSYDTLPGALQALDEGQLSYPLVVKPRWGTASIGIDYARDRGELERVYHSTAGRVAVSILANLGGNPEHAILIQEKLNGQEYGLDVVNNLEGQYVATFARRKLAMRAGETDRAVTVIDSRLEALGARLGQQLKHIGNLDCDVFEVGGVFYVLEMNPRFGGGYPFSHTAGADIPAALIAWAAGQTADPSWLQIAPDVAASKCDRIVATRK